VDVRVFVAGETDETNLASFLGVEHGLLRAALGKDAVRIFKADDLVMLNEIETVGLEALEGFIDLLSGFVFGAAVELGHEEDLLAIAIF